MIDAQSKRVLLDLVRRESRSLLQYVSESFPWITAQEQEFPARLQKLVHEERDGVAAMARDLTRLRISPAPLGPYPMTFTNINYMSLDHLLPLLIENQRRRITELETEIKPVSDPDSRRLSESYLDMKRRHLKALEEMVRTLAKAVPASTAQ
jgi:hypothetical protein